MSREDLKKISYLLLIVLFGFTGVRCAGPAEEMHAHGEIRPIKTYPKDYVHPIREINLEKVIDENRGVRVFEDNATTVHDNYRGAVQQKAEGETLLKQGKWEEARLHFEKSNKFLGVVLTYLSEDEAYRNIYGDHVVTFLPNLLMADNYLKLIAIYKKMKRDDEAVKTADYGQYHLLRSLKSVKTEWAFQVEKGLGEASKKK